MAGALTAACSRGVAFINMSKRSVQAAPRRLRRGADPIISNTFPTSVYKVIYFSLAEVERGTTGQM